jgi:DNA integrity scanning protein DisA with diadenylate cyclase activity
LEFIYDINLKDLFNNFAGYVGMTGPLSIIRAIVDIGLVTYVIYKVIILVRETRAWQLIKGILFILVAAELSKILKLNTIAYILSKTVSILALAMVVLFQPELRRGLEQIGTLVELTGKKGKPKAIYKLEEMSETQQDIVRALDIVDLHNNRPKIKGLGVYK